MDSQPLQPLATLTGRLGWRLEIIQVIFEQPPYLEIRAIPLFPGVFERIGEEADIIWDLSALIKSVKRPGAHQVITCSCDYAPHADLEQAVWVSHPDEHTVAWELSIEAMRPALADVFFEQEDGFIRVVFARDEYEADVRSLLRELQHICSRPVLINTLVNPGHVEALRRSCPGLEHILVESMEPGGQLALEALLELDLDASWAREPLWPAGTQIEFGFFKHLHGHNLMRLNEVRVDAWPGWFFTRHAVAVAFDAWLTSLQAERISASSGDAEFESKKAWSDVPCHVAGRQFAAIFQVSLNEGFTAPSVTVGYRESPQSALIAEDGDIPKRAETTGSECMAHGASFDV